MRNLLIIFSIFFLNSCRNYDFKISELKQEKLKFSNLPVEVKEYLIQPLEFDNENPNLLLVIDVKETDRYVLETVNTWVGPWVDYMKLLDATNNVTYRINQGVPDPYIIFENKLYIPDRFNVFTTVEDISKVEFTCYTLK